MLGEIEKRLGRDRIEAAVRDAAKACGADRDGTIEVELFDWQGPTPHEVIDDTVLKDWVDTLCEDVANDRVPKDGALAHLRTYLAHKTCDKVWWADECVRIEWDVADRAAKELASEAGIDETEVGELADEVLESFMWGHVNVVPDVDGLTDAYGDVCVDLFLAEDPHEEWNSDFTTEGALASDMLYGDDEDLARNLRDHPNAVAWLCEGRGLPRDAAADPSCEGAHDLRSELANAPGSSRPLLTAFVRVPLAEWAEALLAHLTAWPRGLGGKLATKVPPRLRVNHADGLVCGLFDPFEGGGAALEADVARGDSAVLEVGLDHVVDLAMDGKRRLVGAMVGTQFSAHDVYGVNDEMWKRRHLRVVR